MKNIINNVTWFTRGLFLKLCPTPMTVFTKTVPGFGEMTCKAKNLKSCKTWKMTVPHCLFWDNVSVILPDPWKNDEELQTLQDLYKMLQDESDLIKKAITEQVPDPKFLKNYDEVWMEIHLYDIDGKTLFSFVNITYQTEDDLLFVAISIEKNGEVTVDIN